MKYTITENKKYNSLEISFEGKPSEEIRTALKELKFRWNPKKSVWYGFAEIGQLAFLGAVEMAKPEKAKPKKEKKNKFGVKVGDFFSASWGYEQTNVDFFQVIALVGEQSVRIREVHPEMIKEEAVCSMAADRYYNLDTSKLLPAAPTSVFIEDQEKGDLKRIKSYAADGVSNPLISLSSFANAYHHSESQYKAYESWYY